MSKIKDLITQLYDEIRNTDEYNFSEEITEDADDLILRASKGYSNDVNVLCHLEDTGNGYIASFPSYSSSHQHNYICMDYSEADYLRKLLNHMENKKNQKGIIPNGSI